MRDVRKEVMREVMKEAMRKVMRDVMREVTIEVTREIMGDVVRGDEIMRELIGLISNYPKYPPTFVQLTSTPCDKCNYKVSTFQLSYT